MDARYLLALISDSNPRATLGEETKKNNSIWMVSMHGDVELATYMYSDLNLQKYDILGSYTMFA